MYGHRFLYNNINETTKQNLKYRFSEYLHSILKVNHSTVSLLFCLLGSLHVIMYACLYLVVLTIN